jgi:hypothetical protein
MHADAVALGTGPEPIMTVPDPVGDSPKPQGDITGAGFAQNANSFAFGVTVADPVDPATDAVWQQHRALLGFALDANGDGLPEWLIEALTLGPSDTEVVLTSFANPSGQNCLGQFAYVPNSGYRVTFANHCLPGSLRFRFQAVMAYGIQSDLVDIGNFDAAPSDGFSQPFTTVAAPPGSSGYWMLGADGWVYGFGNVTAFVDFNAIEGPSPSSVVAMSGRQDGNGYWIVDPAGHVFAWGTARYFGGSPRLIAGERITTMSPTKTENGYWLFSNRGRAFPFGDARSYGDMSGKHLNGSIVASVASAGGHGYYMVGSDGGIFSFGDARFYGSTGNLRLTKPIIGIAPTPDNRGYWLVGSDGGVFSFGDASFHGSMGAVRLTKPIVGIVAYGNGYLMAGADGGVFDFSSKPFLGSLAGDGAGVAPGSGPIVGLAATLG